MRLWVWDQAAVSVMTALPSRMAMCWPVSAWSWVMRSLLSNIICKIVAW